VDDTYSVGRSKWPHAEGLAEIGSHVTGCKFNSRVEGSTDEDPMCVSIMCRAVAVCCRER
jgi:hypothetical protein